MIKYYAFISLICIHIRFYFDYYKPYIFSSFDSDIIFQGHVYVFEEKSMKIETGSSDLNIKNHNSLISNF